MRFRFHLGAFSVFSVTVIFLSFNTRIRIWRSFSRLSSHQDSVGGLWVLKNRDGQVALSLDGTVDGPEIRRSPAEAGSLSHYLQVFFIHPRW